MAAPCIKDAQAVLQKSQQLWQTYAHHANSRCGLAENITDPTSVLYRVPAMPNNHTLKQVPNGSLLEAHGQATWKFQPNAKCTLSESTATKELIIGVYNPIKFTAMGIGFQNWEKMLNRGEKAGIEIGNHLAILIPCWAYILSNFLVKTQGSLMEYTSVSAPFSNIGIDCGDSGFRVHVGDADLKEARWWSAVLAPGQGWRPVISTSPDATYLAPWAMEYHGDPQFFIETSNPTSSDNNIGNASPPSHEEALRYLTSYCLLHELGTQYTAALSAVLILPLQNLLGRQVQLPKPVKVQTSKKPSISPDIQKWIQELPYLVTLSCATRVLSSALWSVFWEPEIDCNLASAWLFPISKVISPLLETSQYEYLVGVLALHRPTVGPLWLGATLTGLSTYIPHFLQTLEAPYARPDSVASAWLGVPQLFMDTSGTGSYICNGAIHRADRWRLLHDVGLSPYGSTPLTSWQPFGWMPLSALELDVMAHVGCERHVKQYTAWEWFGRNGLKILGADSRASNNTGVEKTISLSVEEVLCLEPQPDQGASIAATRSIFAWLSVGGEGWGESERPIFEHPWLADLVPSDTDESTSNASWEADEYSE